LKDPLQVGILQGPLAIPPKEEVEAKHYTYTPCPLEGEAPIPEHIFLHHLTCEKVDAVPAWLPRLQSSYSPVF